MMNWASINSRRWRGGALALFATMCLGLTLGCTGRPSTEASDLTTPSLTTVGNDSLTAVPADRAAVDPEPLELAQADDAQAAAKEAAAESEEAQAEGEADPRDWTYWRGPEYNLISRETGLPDEIDPRGGEGSNLLWKREELGGRSTPVTMNGKLYTIVRDQPGTKKEGEKVVCVDAKSGETLWETRWNVWLSDVPDTRVGWSSVVADPESGNVYALGVADYFVCLDGETGEIVWDKPLSETFGMLNTYGGRTNFPIVHEDLVIISGIVIGWGDMAKPAHRFLGFDKLTGEVVWFEGTRLLPYDTNYSSPSLAVIDGVKSLVFGSGDGGVWAFQPRTGQPIWKYQLSRRGINSSPLVVGDTVYASHGEENISGNTMGALVAIDAAKGTAPDVLDITKSGKKWFNYEVMVGRSSPLHIDGRIYVIDDRGKMFIYDAETGDQIAREALGRGQYGAPLYADGKIYAVTGGGRWYILKPSEEGVETVSKGRIDGDVISTPIISRGVLYVQTTEALYAFADESKEHGYAGRPEQPEETPLNEHPEPAHVQVVPAEAIIQPGRMQMFQVKLYNERGQLVNAEPEDVEYSVEGPGQIQNGMYLAPSDAGHKAAVITARAEGLEGTARVRIVPELPWEFTFEEMSEPPITWVGARYRHVVREVDGDNVMVKITTIPKGTRSRAWMGPTDLHDYTVQADVKGAEVDGKMPDIGITAQGYALDMMGEHQELQIRTWTPQLRMASTMSFSWEPDKWYTMKLQAGNENGQTVLRAKVWPQGEEEPEEWTLTATDPVGQKSGSPGLYGNATNAEIFYDNIEVYENK